MLRPFDNIFKFLYTSFSCQNILFILYLILTFQDGKKKFEKQTIKFCQSQERYLNLSTKKQDNVLQEVHLIIFKQIMIVH